MAFTDIGSELDTFASSATSYTASVVVPTLDANSIGFVCISTIQGAPRTIDSVTWNGDAMTAGSQIDTGNYRSEIWYRVNPDNNGTYDIIVTFGGTSVIRSVAVVTGWANADGVVSLDDTSTDIGVTTDPISITSTQVGTNELVVSASISSANALAAPYVIDCTALQGWDSGADCMVFGYSIPAGSGDVTHTHDYSEAGTYAIVSLSFKEAGAVSISVSQSASVSPSISPSISPSVSPSISLSSSVSPSISPSVSPSASLSPSASISPSAPPIQCPVCWGHVTGVTETVQTFADNWAGTGVISGAGDAEKIELNAGEFMISEVVYTDVTLVTLLQNNYDGSGDDVDLDYRHGSTEANCLAAAWNNYVAPFASLGYVQIRLTSTL